MPDNPIIKPLTGYALAENKNVLAPPYDVLSQEDVARYQALSAYNMVHITRAESCLKLNDWNHEALNYSKEKLHNLLASSLFEKNTGPFMAIYKIQKDAHLQIGILALADVDKIKTHEHTREKKVSEQMELTNNLRAQISPILLCYKNEGTISTSIKQIIANRQPSITTVDDNGFYHSIYLTKDNAECEKLQQMTNQLKNLYIADGHHRHQTIKSLSKNDPSFVPFVLAAIFPENELCILGYHRLFALPSEAEKDNLIDAIYKHFSVTPQKEPFVSSASNEIGLCLAGNWFKITTPSHPNFETGAEALSINILEPLLVVNNIRTDARVNFIGGQDALLKMTEMTKKDPLQIGFSVSPVSIETILNTADKHQVMPPKSTWFEPKLLDGFVITPIV